MNRGQASTIVWQLSKLPPSEEKRAAIGIVLDLLNASNGQQRWDVEESTNWQELYEAAKDERDDARQELGMVREQVARLTEARRALETGLGRSRQQYAHAAIQLAKLVMATREVLGNGLLEDENYEKLTKLIEEIENDNREDA